MDVANNPAFGRGTKDTIFTIRLKLANTINMQELTDLINGASPCTTNCLTSKKKQIDCNLSHGI